MQSKSLHHLSLILLKLSIILISFLLILNRVCIVDGSGLGRSILDNGSFGTILGCCWRLFYSLFWWSLVSFDDSACLIVEIWADLWRGLNVLVALQEVVELSETSSKIFHADAAILIEIEAKIVFVHEDLNVWVCASNISHKLLLALVQHVDEHANEICRFIIKQNDLLWELLELLDQLCASTLDSFILLNIVNVRVGQLVSLASLDVLQALATLIKPQIKKILCDNLQSIKNFAILLRGCGKLMLFLLFDRLSGGNSIRCSDGLLGCILSEIRITVGWFGVNSLHHTYGLLDSGC